MRFLIFAVLAVLAWIFLRRANELCVVKLSSDGARLVRGRAPPPLLSDVAEVARRARVTATVRVVIESGVPRLLAPAGLDETVVQQLRNVVGQYKVVNFRTGRRAS